MARIESRKGPRCVFYRATNYGSAAVYSPILDLRISNLMAHLRSAVRSAIFNGG